MKQTLHKRLGRLETVSAAARRARESSANKSDFEAWLNRTREFLRSHGIEQLPHESFADTLARGLGMTGRELDDLFRARAYGHSH